MNLIEKVSISKEEKKFMMQVMMSGVRFDYKKINALDNEEFRQFYNELMTEYKDNDGWWTNGNVPHCATCHNIVSGPEQLARYHGMTLHRPCFKEFWKKERSEERATHGEMDFNYWERVASLG